MIGKRGKGRDCKGRCGKGMNREGKGWEGG